MGQTLTEIMEGCTVAIETFTDLGFAISMDKSVLTPTKKIEFLGFVLDSENMSVSVGLAKATKIKELLMEMLQKQACSIRELASLLGKLQAKEPANAYMQLRTKAMEI